MDQTIRKRIKQEDFLIRPYEEKDLADIRECISKSYQELIDLFDHDPIMQKFCRDGLHEILTKGDLSSIENLQKKYHQSKIKNGESFLVVVENAHHKVIGCIGGFPQTPFDFELCRLYVDASYRGFGLGSLLVQHVLDYAKTFQYEYVCLTCGSKSGQALYKKMGFSLYDGYHFFQKVNSKRRIENVAILGGTHGNELVGIHLVQKVWDMGEKLPKYPSFACKTFIANEDAAKRNVRFVDRDLNRCFELDELLKPKVEEASKLETKRALWLNEQIGPKCVIPCSIGRWKQENPHAVDYLVDLHSTTSNM
jgi:GNAT superfamily N-acetyltransferase